MRTVSSYRSWVILALFFSTACAIALTSFLLVRQVPSRFHDARAYLAMAGDASESDPVNSPFRYRVITPWMVASLPSVPAPSSLGRFKIDEARDIQMRFALVNVVGLTLAAWWLFLWLEKLGFARLEALVGGLLYLGSFYPLYLWTLPHTDAWAQAFLVGGLVLLVDRRWGLLAAFFAVAIFEKESILLLPAMALFLGLSRRELVRTGLAITPGLVAYGWFRVQATPSGEPSYWLASVRGYLTENFLTGETTLYYLFGAIAAFGVLWPLAGLGWRRAADHPLLGRLRWFLLVFIPAPFPLLVHASKFWFYAFPIVIPLALMGLQRAWGEDSTPRASVAPRSAER